MCAIVAAAANNNIVPVLIEGLKKQEYRGYESTGLAVIGNGNIERMRSVGRVSYHAALVIGTDVDKPRNLAKSVTVE